MAPRGRSSGRFYPGLSRQSKQNPRTILLKSLLNFYAQAMQTDLRLIAVSPKRNLPAIDAAYRRVPR